MAMSFEQKLAVWQGLVTPPAQEHSPPQPSLF
jgi:hypothetical protein